MSGKAIVSRTSDWLTPFVVEVAIDGRRTSTARFPAAARAQTYVLDIAEEHDLTIDYRIERQAESEGRGKPTITPEQFAARMTRVCAKCRHAVPLADFRVETHRNRNGHEVHHGWAKRCLPCEEAHGA